MDNNEKSTATVAGEFTDKDLTRIYNEANGINGGKNPPITTERIFKAMRACLALNQRLAVKEGEAVGYTIAHNGETRINEACETLQDIRDKFAEEIDTGIVEVVTLYTAQLYTHPVSDDQQAKDAALVQNPYTGNGRSVVRDAWQDGFDGKHQYIFTEPYNRCYNEGKAAALSTTKQDGS